MTNGAKKKFVFSPYWDNAWLRAKGIKIPDNVNPHFPFGCPKFISQRIIKEEMQFLPKRGNKVISLSRLKESRLNELKKAKRECVNPKNLTTIVRASLDPRLAIGV